MTADDVRRYLWKVRPQGVHDQEAVVRSVLNTPEHMQQLWLDTMLDGAAKLESDVLKQHEDAARALCENNPRYWCNAIQNER